MDFQAYNKILICKDDNITNVDIEGITIGYEFKIKYPSYRGVYLSCIEDLKFKLDGQEIPEEDIYFFLNDKQFVLSELKDCFKEYWFIRDKAIIRVMNDEGIEPGQHELNVYMKHRVPYTGYFGQYLVLESNVTETMQA